MRRRGARCVHPGDAVLPVPVLKALARELLNGDYDETVDKVLLTGGAETNRFNQRYH